MDDRDATGPIVKALAELAVHPGPVQGAEVLDLETAARGPDDRVPARDERILDRHVAIRASSQDGRSTREIELLE